MKEFFKEIKENKLSFARLTGFLLVVFYILWACFIVFTEKRIPDIPLYVFLLISALYGLNKFAEVFRNGKKG